MLKDTEPLSAWVTEWLQGTWQPSDLGYFSWTLAWGRTKCLSFKAKLLGISAMQRLGLLSQYRSKASDTSYIIRYTKALKKTDQPPHSGGNEGWEVPRRKTGETGLWWILTLIAMFNFTKATYIRVQQWSFEKWKRSTQFYDFQYWWHRSSAFPTELIFWSQHNSSKYIFPQSRKKMTTK